MTRHTNANVEDPKVAPSTEVDLTVEGAVGHRGRPAGGWACRLAYKQHYIELEGTVPGGSAPRMTVMAAIFGLRRLKRPCTVHVYSTLDYFWDCARRLLRGRRTDSFVSDVGKGCAKNADLWKEFRLLAKKHRILIHPVVAVSKRDQSGYVRARARAAARHRTGNDTNSRNLLSAPFSIGERPVSVPAAAG